MRELFSPLVLPNQTVLPNRLAKAAMEESLCNAEHAPSDGLIRLYERWADGECGLIITGNVMVDRHALTGPSCVILESDRNLDRFEKWAAAAKRKSAQVWMQINHPGRQMMANLGQQALAPSPIRVDIPGLKGAFSAPRAMSVNEIEGVIRRFVNTAMLAQRAGFDGVQIHAAHGYLISQFLSPLTNHRTDSWGGSLENRARLLLDTVKAVRAKVSPNFVVAVKLNSADFQKGGFTLEEASEVMRWLNPLGVDLVELSGGSYENPAMRGYVTEESTAAREAYFLTFAKQLTEVAQMPLMVTGGIRRLDIARQVIADGISMVGMATALASHPDLPKRWRTGDVIDAPEVRVTWSHKAFASAAVSAVVKAQLERLGKGLDASTRPSPTQALFFDQINTSLRARCYRKWIEEFNSERAGV